MTSNQYITKNVDGFILPKSDNFFSKKWKNNTGLLLSQYQYHQYKLAKEYVSEFECSIDIGANIGIISNNMAVDFTTVYCFEPIDSVYYCLEKNTSTYKNIKTYNVAISDTEGYTNMVINHTNIGCSKISSNGTHNVVKKTLDSYHFENVGFIKIDVEGHESKVIQGAIDTITQHKPVIMLEQWERNQIAGKKLEELGMKLQEKIKDDYIYTF